MSRSTRVRPTLVPLSRSFLAVATLAAGAVSLGATLATAATPEAACQTGRYGAASRYAQCEQRATGKYLASGDSDKYQVTISKCRVKYGSAWTKLQAQATGTGSSCDTGRYTVGGGTVTDNLTGLQWEQKTNDASIHDRLNNYTWSVSGTAADGTVFTTFLDTLNTVGCFAGHCDWRLPTRAELATTLFEPYPCVTNPCIDQSAFGPYFGVDTWTSTPSAIDPNEVWRVFFFDGTILTDPKTFGGFARAVRGGL